MSALSPVCANREDLPPWFDKEWNDKMLEKYADDLNKHAIGWNNGDDPQPPYTGIGAHDYQPYTSLWSSPQGEQLVFFVVIAMLIQLLLFITCQVMLSKKKHAKSMGTYEAVSFKNGNESNEDVQL